MYKIIKMLKIFIIKYLPSILLIMAFNPYTSGIH